MFLKILKKSRQNICAGFSFLKEILSWVFLWEICEIFKKTFLTEYLRVIAYEKD